MTFALDVSSSCIGFALFDDKANLMELNYVKFNSKLSLFEKVEEFKKVIAHIFQMDIKRIAIEEPLKKFKGKFSSASTIAVLNIFNGMISATLYNHFKIEPIYYNVRSARTIVFPKFKATEGSSQKHEVWSRVMEMEPTINWKYGIRSRKLLDENYDMADAYVVGMADILTVIKQKEILNKKQK